VLAGKADHITLNGIDRWIGGVHLFGNQVPWRWDERVMGSFLNANWLHAKSFGGLLGDEINHFSPSHPRLTTANAEAQNPLHKACLMRSLL